MSVTPRSVINMAKNTITSQPNCEKHQNDSYYLKKQNEQIYVTFQEQRVDVWHDGQHQKAFEVKNQRDMNEGMQAATSLIKDINNVLDDVLRKKQGQAVEESLKAQVSGQVSNPVFLEAQPGKHEGKIIAESNNFVAQRLGDQSKYVMFHQKAKLDQVPPVGTKVSITVSNDLNNKSKVVKALENQKTNSLTRSR